MKDAREKIFEQYPELKKRYDESLRYYTDPGSIKLECYHGEGGKYEEVEPYEYYIVVSKYDEVFVGAHVRDADSGRIRGLGIMKFEEPLTERRYDLEVDRSVIIQYLYTDADCGRYATKGYLDVLTLIKNPRRPYIEGTFEVEIEDKSSGEWMKLVAKNFWVGDLRK